MLFCYALRAAAGVSVLRCPSGTCEAVHAVRAAMMPCRLNAQPPAPERTHVPVHGDRSASPAQVLHAKTMHVDTSDTKSHAALISSISGFVEHPDDTFVANAHTGTDHGYTTQRGAPDISGSIDSDGSLLEDVPPGGLLAECSLQRDSSVPTSVLNPNYEYELPCSLALVAPEPDEDNADEMLKPSLFDRDAGGYRQRQPDPPGVVAAAASAAEARAARHAPPGAANAAAAAAGHSGADRPLIDLSSEHASAADASGSASRSGGGSGSYAASHVSGAGGGHHTAPPLGTHREPSLQARSGGFTGSTVIRTPFTDTEGSRGTEVYVPHTHTTVGGHTTEGMRSIERTVDGTIDEDEVHYPAAGLRRPREIDSRVYSTLAPAADVNLATTDASSTDGGIIGVIRQLEVFSKRDLFLGRFELLGRQQRRRGGVPAVLLCTYLRRGGSHSVVKAGRSCQRRVFRCAWCCLPSCVSACMRCLHAPNHVMPAGQAVVQFARGARDRCDYAVKFFLDHEAFFVEAALYAACFPDVRKSLSPEVAARAADMSATTAVGGGAAVQMSAAAARFLPQVEAVCDGAAGDLVDPNGQPLPPCIVMEKGESLQEWSNRAEPDLFTALAVRTARDWCSWMSASVCVPAFPTPVLL